MEYETEAEELQGVGEMKSDVLWRITCVEYKQIRVCENTTSD